MVLKSVRDTCDGFLVFGYYELQQKRQYFHVLYDGYNILKVDLPATGLLPNSIDDDLKKQRLTIVFMSKGGNK
jgi:hypothetical protein